MEKDDVKQQTLTGSVTVEYAQEQHQRDGEQRLHLKSFLVLIVSHLKGSPSVVPRLTPICPGDCHAKLLPNLQVSLVPRAQSTSIAMRMLMSVLNSVLGVSAVGNHNIRRGQQLAHFCLPVRHQHRGSAGRPYQGHLAISIRRHRYRRTLPHLLKGKRSLWSEILCRRRLRLWIRRRGGR